MKIQVRIVVGREKIKWQEGWVRIRSRRNFPHSSTYKVGFPVSKKKVGFPTI